MLAVMHDLPSTRHLTLKMYFPSNPCSQSTTVDHHVNMATEGCVMLDKRLLGVEWQVFTHVCCTAEMVKKQCKGLVWTKYLEVSLGILYLREYCRDYFSFRKNKAIISIFGAEALTERTVCTRDKGLNNHKSI